MRSLTLHGSTKANAIELPLRSVKDDLVHGLVVGLLGLDFVSPRIRPGPAVFLRQLAALVPRPRLHLIRFHGILAPNAGLRAQVVPLGPVRIEEERVVEGAAAECEGGQAASAGQGCSSEPSTSTCSAARSAAAGN